MTKQDDIWADLVEKLHIDLTRPVCSLSESELRVALGGRTDLRLAISMDSKKRWPKILQANNNFILPRSRSEWFLVRGNGFRNLDDPGGPIPFQSRLSIELSTLAYGRGENGYLLHAFNSGLLDDFCGAGRLYPTISGKGATSSFTYRVNGHPPLDVESAGMEIDQGFESQSSVLLFEAKVGKRENFLTRQLYFPYRSHLDFQMETAKKAVRSFFFVADPRAGTYSLWEFSWRMPEDYESIVLEKKGCFRVVEQLPDQALFRNVTASTDAPEFQADDLKKVLEVPFLVSQGVRSAAAWADYYGYAQRQGNYYAAAAQKLGLVASQSGTLDLTADGERFLTLSPTDRSDWVAKRLLEIPTMNAIYREIEQNGVRGVGVTEIAKLIRANSRLTGTTLSRRAQSIRAYFKWLAQTTGCVVVKDRRIFPRSAWETLR